MRDGKELDASGTFSEKSDPIQQHVNTSEKSHLPGAQEKSDEGMACWKDLPVKWQVDQ